MTICQKFDIFDISYNFKHETILGYTFQLFRLKSLTQMPHHTWLDIFYICIRARSHREGNMNASLHDNHTVKVTWTLTIIINTHIF